MKTYVINFTNGRKIRLTGDPVESAPDGDVVVLRNGVDTYNIMKEHVLFWSVSDADDQGADDMVESGLTERQKKILDGMTRSKTNRAIAYELGYSESTIRQESMAIYRALGVSGREEAAAVVKEAAEVERLDSLVQV